VFIGKEVTVKLYAQLNGSKQFFGKLLKAEDGNVTLEVGGEAIEIEKAKVASVRIDLFEEN
jgi:ribosome maturation factor RimP